MVDVYIGAGSTVEVPESTNHSAGFVTRLENNKTFHITQKYQRLTKYDIVHNNTGMGVQLIIKYASVNTK